MILNTMSIGVYKKNGTQYIYYDLLEPSYDSCDIAMYIIDYWNEKLLILRDGEDDLFEFLNNSEFEEIDISFNNYSINFNYPYNVNKSEFKKWVINYSNDSEIPLSKAFRNAIMDM